MKLANKVLVVLALFSLLVLSGCGGGVGGADYEGTWSREGTYVDGDKVSDAAATLKLTASSFDSSAEACANSGSISVQGNTMRWTVEESNCPSIINVGSTTTHTYSVSPDGSTLTLINTEFGAEVKEVYTKA